MNAQGYVSQMGEDEYLDTEIFKGKLSGVFVDIGAHDGVTFSNTYFFEKNRKWSGLCVEPLPDIFKRLKRNRAAISVQAAIAKKRDTTSFLFVEGKDNAEMFSGIAKHLDDRQLARIHDELEKRGGTSKVLKIQTVPINELLQKHRLFFIDYMSIDTEGSEFEIVKSLNFDLFHVKCFTIENTFSDPNLTSFMESKGYSMVKRLDLDDVYVRKSDENKTAVNQKDSPDTHEPILHIDEIPKTAQGKISLTVIIHTKNEEENIKECISSIDGLTKDIIVADMESTDKTRELAAKLGAKVIVFKSKQMFADATRNKAITRAKGKWILELDADERLTLTLKKIIQRIISSDCADVIKFPRKNIMLGKWMIDGLQWPDYQTRLFKKGYVFWPEVIHPVAVCKGVVKTLEAKEECALVHFHTRSIEQLVKKWFVHASQERYYDELPHFSLSKAQDRISNEFPWRFVEHKGYLNGMRGLVVNKLMEYYRFLEFALFWERKGYPEFASPETILELWDREKLLRHLEQENRELKDAKIYRFYLWMKKMKGVLGIRLR